MITVSSTAAKRCSSWLRSRKLWKIRDGCCSGSDRPYPILNLSLKHRHGQCARHKHLRVEGTHIEARSEFLLGLGAKAPNGQLADFVRERLARNGDIALNLRGGIGAAHRRIVEHVGDRRIAAPTLSVDTGVDDQAHGPQDLVIQMAVQLIRIGEHPKFGPKALRVERPAFDIGGITTEALECWQRGVFLRQTDLVMVARDAFVEEQRLETPSEPRRQIIRVVIENSGARSVWGTLQI